MFTMKELAIKKKESFLDYIFGGCDIGLQVAIDFTGSNGDPRNPNSLHYLDDNRNEYLAAIRAVGTILEAYDTSKTFPVYGFGGRVPGSGTSHCFALNGDFYNPEVSGVQGIEAIYKSSI